MGWCVEMCGERESEIGWRSDLLREGRGGENRHAVVIKIAVV